MLKRLWSRRQDVLGALIQRSGAGRAYEALYRPDGAIVLMYHSISDGSHDAHVDAANRLPVGVFERQMAFLSEQRQVISLTTLNERISRAASPAAGTVCITFDDGYLDNLTVAAPLLAKYRLPATLFLATGYVQRIESQWADVLHSIWTTRTSERLALPELGIPLVDLRSAKDAAAARRSLHRHLLESLREQRARWLEELESQLKPDATRPRLTINWDEVRSLLKRYPLFEIGGHTRDHIDLRTHTGDLAKSQIDGCATDIRRELDVTPRHFSFPYGRWSESSRALVSNSGWSCAVGEGRAVRIGASSDRFAMPRVEAPAGMTGFRFKTSGAFPGALALLGVS